MRCSNCHSETPNGYRYCLNCGEDLGAPTLVKPATLLFEQSPAAVMIQRRPWKVFGGVAGGLFLAALAVLGLIAAYSIFTYFYGGDPLGITFMEYQL